MVAPHSTGLAPLLGLFLLTCFSPTSSAQWWQLEVDTLTRGKSINRHPVVPHDVMIWSERAPFVVFERLEDGESQIALLGVDPMLPAWDAEPVILSSSPESMPQRRPDCSVTSVYRQTGPTGWTPVTLALVAWERLVAGHWNIWYAFQGGDGLAWSAPRPLTVGARNDMFVQVRGGLDSTFVVSWQADSILFFARIGPDGEPGAAETLAVSNFRDFRHHTVMEGWNGGFRVVWTVRSDSGTIRAVHRFERPLWEGGGLSEPDTLPALEGLTAARLTIHPLGGSIVLFEQELQLGWTTVSDIYAWSEYGYPQPDNLTGEPEVLDRSPSSFTIPVVTQKPAAPMQLYWFDILAYERIDRAAGWADSGIVIRTYGLGDTIRGPGYARRPCVGSIPFTSPQPPYLARVPVVWEAGVGVRTQIYGGFVEIFSGDVREAPQLPASPVLHQNFPNPFNPVTNIEYLLPRQAEIRLSVFNVLGEEVAELATGLHTPGLYRVRWDGSGVAGGVYICRLSSPGHVRSVRMLLLR